MSTMFQPPQDPRLSSMFLHPNRPHIPRSTTSMYDETADKDPSLSPEILRRRRSSTILYESFLRSVEDGQIHLANQIKDELQHLLREESSSSSSRMSTSPDSIRKSPQLYPISEDEEWFKMQKDMTQKLQQAQDRMFTIHNSIRAILEQDYHFHENPPPRLFIVLPKDEVPWDSQNPHNNQFRLYFLCDCGEHTRQRAGYSLDPRQRSRSKSHGSQIPHHIHLAKHEGYDIDKPHQFFYEFGSYLLNLLYMFKFGVSIAGYYVPALMPPKAIGSISPGLNPAFNNFAYDITPGVNQAIEHLQTLVTEGLIPTTMTDNEAKELKSSNDPNIPAFAGVVELKLLYPFLKAKNGKAPSFANLQRMVTSTGNVKWVCSDHFGEAFDAMSIRELSTNVGSLRGKFEECLGRVEITLLSSTGAIKFYKAMESAALVSELVVKLDWEINTNDLKALYEGLQRSNVSSLDITCTPSTGALFMNRKKKRADLLWDIMSLPNLSCFILREYTGFFANVSTPANTIHIRKLEIHERMEWKKDGTKVIELIRHSPNLVALRLGCSNVESAYEAIEPVMAKLCPLEHIVIDGGEHIGIQARFRRRKLVWMEILVPDLTSRFLSNSSGVKSLHLRPRVPADFDPNSLETVIAKNPSLTKLKIHCPVAKMQGAFMLIKEAASMNTKSDLNTLILYELRNQLFSNNLKGHADAKLELMSTNTHSEPLDMLIRGYGSRLTKLQVEGEGYKSLSQLAITLRQTKASILDNILIASSFITCEMMQDLRTVLRIAGKSISQLGLVLFEEWDPTSKRLADLADFIVEIGPFWTSIMIGKTETVKWKEVLRERGFSGLDSVFKKGPSVAKRLLEMESTMGMVPAAFLAKLNKTDDVRENGTVIITY